MFIYWFNQMSLSMRMKGWMCAYIVVAGLLLLVAPAGALVPDKVEVGTSSEWLTAGSGETAIITVQVSDTATGITGFGGGTVEFAVDSAFGSITPAVATTDATGMATALFTPRTVSGTVPITATVSYETLDEPLTGSVDQQIDHAAPYRIANIWYSPEVTVGETTEIAVRMADRYGNVVDNRKIAEIVGFMAGSPSGNATLDSTDVAVDAAGNATATLRVDTLPGENIVLISPPEPLPDRYLTISGVTDGEPCAIEVDVQPGSVIADGTSRFLLTYTLLDGYGNPSSGRVLAFTTSVSDEVETLLTTNVHGQVQVSYGPRETTGNVTITATAVENASVTCSRDLAFVSSDAENLLLSTCPETMPSRDVPGSTPAVIRAKVVDHYGNPVAGETVSFSIRNVAVEPYNQTAPPSLSAASAVTDAYGIASAEFTPGAFTIEYGAPDYSPTATGTCEVVAKWNGIERPVTLTWMNYPYLSVETAVAPETVTVNETVDVTIRLRGDGWAMKPDPIDVLLCVDRAETMVSDYPDHMVTVMGAAPVFIDHMIPGWDRIGLLSFGYNGLASINPTDSNQELTISKIQDVGIDQNGKDDADYIAANYPGDGSHRQSYAGHAILDVPLPGDSSPAANNFNDVRASISTLIPSGGNPVRKALYEGVTELKENGRPGAVKALVFLIDGDYDWYGDPLARAGANLSTKDPEQFGQRTNNWYPFGLPDEEQNMAVYARNNDVRIYTITFSSAVSTDCNETMRLLATDSGGKHYIARTASELAGVYRQIAGDLKTEAGVNTTVDIAFENVEVNSTPVAGDQVFDYVYEEGASTLIRSYNSTAEFFDPYTRDDTAAWEDNRTLHFDIGTIRLNQTWEATFRLRVLEEGTIGLFGNGATITFNDNNRVPLPRVYITAFGEENTTVDTGSLTVSDLNCTSPAAEFLPLAWDLNYTGKSEAVQQVSYSGDGGYTWVRFDTLTSPPGVSPMETSLDVRDLPPGDYMVRVYATAPDAPDAWDTCSVHIGNGQKDYIRLQ
ncbi:MAG: hypothetical protein PWR16_1081 [Methanoculleus sp.]|nr:hypothetical protein [Methanoculleus sp.]